MVPGALPSTANPHRARLEPVSENFEPVGREPHFSLWRAGRFTLDLTAPHIMGILNVTPDSFSDGGSHDSPHRAIEHAEHLLQSGAAILDVGAESTRPGAMPISDQEEWLRLEPVLTELVKWNCPLSLDTYRPATMQKALDLGVDIINDIWALRQPGAMEVVASSHCGLCLMHMEGEPQTMQLNPLQSGVMAAVLSFFEQLTLRLAQAGVDKERWVLDPGIGFGKSPAQNLTLLAQQSELLNLGQPLLVGWSRKSTLGHVTGLAADQRIIPSVAAALMAVERGARIVRVHDVAATREALQIWQAVMGLKEESTP